MNSLSVHAVCMPKREGRFQGLSSVLWCAEAGWLVTGKFKRTRTYKTGSGNSAVVLKEVRAVPTVVV